MKKLLLFFLLPLLAFVSTGCDDDSDVLDTKLIKGQWELVSQDSSDRNCIYNFTTQGEQTWSWGTLTVYYLTVSGTPVHDRVYEWHVDDPKNTSPVYLEMTLTGYLDYDDYQEKTDRYIVEKLTASEMILQQDNAPKTRLRFVRRNDLKIP